MKQCPKCQADTRQVKAGLSTGKRQRYKCPICGCRYTPEAKEVGYPASVREQAVKLYVDGMSFRRIAPLGGESSECHQLGECPCCQFAQPGTATPDGHNH